ncbi:MAG: hypothetical protein ACK559_37860 [bacterium]
MSPSHSKMGVLLVTQVSDSQRITKRSRSAQGLSRVKVTSPVPGWSKAKCCSGPV